MLDKEVPMREKVFIICSVIVISFLIVFIPGAIIGGAFSYTMDYEDAEKSFQENKENILIVKEYLISENGVDYITVNNYNDISDKKVLNAIIELRMNGYDIFCKEGNTIVFQITSKLDYGAGIACTISNSVPSLRYLTYYESLSEDGWYYWEEDYNEWRLQNG